MLVVADRVVVGLFVKFDRDADRVEFLFVLKAICAVSHWLGVLDLNFGFAADLSRRLTGCWCGGTG